MFPFKAVIFLYVKMAVTMGLAYTLLIGLVMLLLYGPGFEKMAAVQVGLEFGALMSLLLGTLHILSMFYTVRPLTVEALGVCHTRQITVHLPCSAAFGVGLSSLATLENYRIESKDEGRGVLAARVGNSWKSFGERVSLEFRENGDDTSTIRITSKPSSRTTICDYGKNFDNVEKLKDYFEDRSAMAP